MKKEQAEGTWDEAKGRTKQAAGDLTNDRKLKTEGKKDEIKGRAKKAVGRVKQAGDDLRGK